VARKSKDLLSFSWSDTSLITAMENLPPEAEAAVARVVSDTTDRAYRKAINKTPVDRGDARRGWKREARGRNGRIYNNVEYINVLELGGYPVTPASHASRTGGFRRGKAILGGAPPPDKRDAGGRFTGTARTQKAPGGEPKMRNNVSKQAPKGMVRDTLREIQPRFMADLEWAITTLPSWAA